MAELSLTLSVPTEGSFLLSWEAAPAAEAYLVCRVATVIPAHALDALRVGSFDLLLERHLLPPTALSVSESADPAWPHRLVLARCLPDRLDVLRAQVGEGDGTALEDLGRPVERWDAPLVRMRAAPEELERRVVIKEVGMTNAPPRERPKPTSPMEAWEQLRPRQRLAHPPPALRKPEEP